MRVCHICGRCDEEAHDLTAQEGPACAPQACDDGNPCTDDAADPNGGCVHVPNTAPCEDGNACTAGDTCGGAICIPGPPPDCDDDNVCTEDACDAQLGCLHQPVPVVPVTCGVGACQRTVPSCDNNVPQVCVPGEPALESCNGLDDDCDGVADEESPSFGEPKTQRYYKRRCSVSHPEDALTQADADCVNDVATSGWVGTVADLCGALFPEPEEDKCEQAEAQLVALLLTRCKGRVYDAMPVAPSCSAHTTVGESLAHADAEMSAAPGFDACVHAQCESEEINSGAAVGTRSLTAEATPEGPLLGWTAPPATPSKPAPATYKVWRRARGEAAFTLLAEVAALSYVDPAVISGPDYEYTVTFDRP